MGYQNPGRLLDTLAAYGLSFTTIAGWERRGSSMFDPQGVIVHHTGGPAAGGDYPSLQVVINGRPDVDGPLANLGLGRSGHVYVVAAGRANHGGVGSYAGVTGNSKWWGIEAENNGSQPWPSRQVDCYHRLCAALCEFSGIPPSMVVGHKEYAKPAGRKPDPHTLNMGVFRTDVGAAMTAPPAPPAPQPVPPAEEEEDMPRIYVRRSDNYTILVWPSGNRCTLAGQYAQAMQDQLRVLYGVQPIGLDDSAFSTIVHTTVNVDSLVG